MLKSLLIASMLATSLAHAEDVFTYRISPECIEDITIVKNANIKPPEKRKYQINVRLEKSEGNNLKVFTKEIIGSNLKIMNGFGESLNFPANRVVKEIGSTFRLSPYETVSEAEEAVRLLKIKGGSCGKSGSS